MLQQQMQQQQQQQQMQRQRQQQQQQQASRTLPDLREETGFTARERDELRLVPDVPSDKHAYRAWRTAMSAVLTSFGMKALLNKKSAAPNPAQWETLGEMARSILLAKLPTGLRDMAESKPGGVLKYPTWFDVVNLLDEQLGQDVRTRIETLRQTLDDCTLERVDSVEMYISKLHTLQDDLNDALTQAQRATETTEQTRTRFLRGLP